MNYCTMCDFKTESVQDLLDHARTHGAIDDVQELLDHVKVYAPYPDKQVSTPSSGPEPQIERDQQGRSIDKPVRKPRSDKGVKREPGKGLLAALNTLEQVPVEPLTHKVRRGGRKPKPNITVADIGHLYMDSKSGRCFRLMDVQSEPQVTFQVISENPTDVPNTETGDLSKFKDYKRLILEK